jgi:hypothetical protein
LLHEQGIEVSDDYLVEFSLMAKKLFDADFFIYQVKSFHKMIFYRTMDSSMLRNTMGTNENQ